MSMYLIQLLLPLYDNSGEPFGRERFGTVRGELAERFGGVTAYLQAPAQGVWKEPGGDVARDDVVTFEVMTEELDRGWWAEYRARMEERFRQDEVVVRALPMDRL